MRKLVLSLFGLSLVAAGCDQRTHQAPSVTGASKVYEKTIEVPRVRPAVPSDDSELKAVMDGARVRCEDGACPAAVGQVIGIEVTDVKILITQCTGELISRDIVMTNSHCIRDSIKKSNKCDGLMAIKFPAVGPRAEEVMNCTQLISATDLPEELKKSIGSRTEQNMDVVDVAFFRVKVTNPRPSFKIARRGIQNQKTLTVYAVDPVADEPDQKIPGTENEETKYRANGTIRKKICVTDQMKWRGYQNDFSEYVYALGNDCKMRHGNSGAAAFDSSGEILGLFYGFNENQRSAFILNLSCLQLDPSIPAPSLPTECSRR